MKELLVYPIVFYFFYTMLLLLYTFFGRLNAVKGGKVSARAFKAYNMEVPENLIIRGRHYDNQFQAPVFFILTCMLFMIFDVVNMVVVSLAWTYVVVRLLHSFVHLGRNYLPHRFSIFGLSWLVLLLMWILLLFLIS